MPTSPTASYASSLPGRPSGHGLKTDQLALELDAADGLDWHGWFVRLPLGPAAAADKDAAE